MTIFILITNGFAMRIFNNMAGKNKVGIKLRILIVHHSLNGVGGGERVALHIIKALQEAGHEVELGTVEKTDWGRVLRISGVRLRSIPREFSLFPIKLNAFGIYQRPLSALSLLFRRGYDLTINTHGDVMPVPTTITYLHFPVFALLVEEPWRFYVKYSRPFWRLYFEPYRLLQEKLARVIFSRTVLLTNSTFSREVIRRCIGRNAVVVYPPVELDDYLSLPLDRKEDVVISIGRMTPEKNFHLILDVARLLPSVRFYIVGAVHGATSVQYYKRLLRLKERRGVRNVEIIPNAPHSLKLELLMQAKVYLHTMIAEHFGIAVAEGMASGCIPVVHESGGQWEDIVERGRYGFGFSELEPFHIAQVVDRALDKWSPEFVERIRRKAEHFSDVRFRRRIVEIVNRVTL